MSTDVFISYGRADHGITKAIAEALEAVGLSIWWDSQLLPGDDIDREIQQVLSQTSVVVAVLSPSSIASDWVMWELSEARRSGLRIVPILVDGARLENLPPSLSSIHTLVLPTDRSQGPFREVACQIHDVVQRSQLRSIERDGQPPRAEETDARRRLAVASADAVRHDPVPTVTGPGKPHGRSTRAGAWSASAGLVSFLELHDIALAFTSPQSGSLYLVGRTPAGELLVHEESFRKTMGLHRVGNTLLMAGLAHIYRLESHVETGGRHRDTFSHCYVPRVSFLTGKLDAHDVGMNDQGEVVFVNTRWNCLAAVSNTHSFKPIWRPHFITEVADGDRCHLNGLAMHDGVPRYATAASRSNEANGWRSQRSSGGIVIDVRKNMTIVDGLAMPHSPRINEDELWLLNSGSGELGFVRGAETDCGRFVPVACCPGYTRGLALHGVHAFVGISRPRRDDFSGFELERRLQDSGSEPWCGIQIIDKNTGDCVEWFRCDQIGEIYDVAVLPHVVCPRSMGPMSDDSFDLLSSEE